MIYTYNRFQTETFNKKCLTVNAYLKPFNIFIIPVRASKDFTYTQDVLKSYMV